jgi:hypothetical protein
MLTVFNDVLTLEENKQVHDFVLVSPQSFWIDGNIDTATSDNFALSKILKLVSTVTDLSKMVGCECWLHVNTRPGHHIDRDEVLFKSTGEVDTPLCSIVYYVSIKDLQDGKFCSDIGNIEPKTNMLLTFPRNLQHYVESFEGERIILAINPWDHRIEID